MSFAKRCLEEFGDAVRFRGQHYVNQSRLWLEDVWEHGARGWAQGSGKARYRVEVDWESSGDGFLEVFCRCPHFFDHGVNCKHLWAFLLLLDQEGVSDVVPGTGRLYLEDLGAGTFPGDVEPDSVAEVSTPWRSHLEAVRNWTQREAAQELASSGPRRQLWAVLHPHKVSATEELEVCFYCRDWLKSGKLGKLKPATLGRKDLDRFDPEDRETLRYLLGLGLSGASGADEIYSAFYDPGGYTRRFRSVSISQMVLDEAFPRLCATERFGWLSADGREVDPLTLLPGSWRWALRVEEGDGKLRLLGSFVRASEEAGPPPKAKKEVMLLESGWMLFRNAVARLEEGPRIFPWAQVIKNQGPIEIPQEEEAEALETLLGIAGLPELELPERMAPQDETATPVPRLRFQARQGLFFGKISFLYGGRSMSAHDPATSWFDETTGRVGYRRLDVEHPALEGLAAVEGLSVRQEEILLTEQHFAEVVRQVHELGWRVEVDHRPVRTSDGFSGKVSSGINWFDLSGRMSFGESQAQLPALLAAIRKKRRYVVLDDGSMGLLPEEWLQRFGPLAGMTGEVEGESLRFERQQGLLLDALLANEEDVDFDTTFEQLRQHLRAASQLEPGTAPKTFQGALRPYQEEGLGWVEWLAEIGLGGCLADDMGLGKTIQVLAYLEEQRLAGESEEGWSLLVVPRSLLRNWVAEGERFTPDLPMHIHHGPGRLEALEALREQARPLVLVTTYGTLRRDITIFREMDFAMVVLDEAQAIKNAASQTAKACRLVRARRRLALTGTPVENHLGELWSLFEFLNPGMLGRLPALSGVAGKLYLPPEALELVARALRPLILRRTKQQVLKDLPQKTEQILYCELSKAERERYDELRDHYRAQLAEKVASVGLGRSKIHVLEALLRLRQAACHPGLLDRSLGDTASAKLEVLVARLEEVFEAGGKALVFSQFTRLLALVRRQLDKKKLTYEYLDGRTRKREEKVERFQTDPDCHLFLISLKAGGVGLNLTAASYVFLLDPWWNPAVESQAIDRAHRIGQERPVFAYRLIARDTVEEKILQMQAAKRSLADAILAQDRGLLGQMTPEDLELLLGGPL